MTGHRPFADIRQVTDTPATIIGLSGYAQSGKDTVGKILKEEWGFVRLAFADALKNVLYDLNPTVQEWAGWGVRRVPLQALIDGNDLGVVGMGWERAKTETLDVRPLLQRLGMAVRDHIDTNAWVNAVMKKCVPGGKYVITDMRFPNEAQVITDAGGTTWRISRPGTGPANDHWSERALDDWRFDARIANNHTVGSLAVAVEHLMLPRQLP